MVESKYLMVRIDFFEFDLFGQAVQASVPPIQDLFRLGLYKHCI
jgi:hypothetical protein